MTIFIYRVTDGYYISSEIHKEFSAPEAAIKFFETIKNKVVAGTAYIEWINADGKQQSQRLA